MNHTQQHTQYDTLSAAMVKIEELISEGFSSFKVFREEKVWWVVVLNIVNEEAISRWVDGYYFISKVELVK
ncbi:hypothetical protein [Robertmurraya sp.]|uniref:hypothetical protein n=1 Tax=Robertmurraya sp. TaxID=2837525 RepID=UPI0037036F5E